MGFKETVSIYNVNHTRPINTKWAVSKLIDPVVRIDTIKLSGLIQFK
jgi:hypothetical protein